MNLEVILADPDLYRRFVSEGLGDTYEEYERHVTFLFLGWKNHNHHQCGCLLCL